MNMKAAALIWDTLLQKIATSRASFYTALVNRLLDELMKPSAADPNFDTTKSAIFRWLVHLLSAREWEAISVTQNDLKTQIVEASLLSPAAWTHKLAKEIIERADHNFRELWAPLYAASLFATSMEDPETLHGPRMFDEDKKEKEDEIADVAMGDEYEPVDARRNASVTVVHAPGQKTNTANVPTDRGWQLWEGGWVPKPIGV
jgi:hypothetical protein